MEKIKSKRSALCVTGIIIFVVTYILSILNKLEMPSILRIVLWVSNYCLLVVIVFFVVTIIEKRKINSLGFTKNSLGTQIILGLVIFFFLILATIIPLLMGISKAEILNFKPKNITVLLFFLFYDIICVGFGEEIIFRGYLLSRLREIAKSNLWAIMLSSILFGLWHYPNNSDIIQVVTTTIVGIIFSTLRVKLKNCSTLSLAIAHGLNDAFIILLGWFLLPG